MPIYNRSTNLVNTSPGGGGFRRLDFQGYGSTAHELSILQMLEGSEYDPSLKGRRGIAIFERMAREDSQNAALLGLIKQPLEAMNWKVESPDEQVRMFVEDQLGLPRAPKEQIENRNSTLDKYITEALQAHELGFSLHEVLMQYNRETGKHDLGALAIRPQISVESFDADDYGLKGVVQITQLSPEKKTKYLNKDRLVYISYNQIGQDYWGRSIIRPNYRNWFFKDALMLMYLISSKRYNVPVPHAIHRRGMPPKWKKRMETTLKNLDSDSASYIITGRQNKEILDWELGHYAPDIKQWRDDLPFIKYLDEQAAKAFLILFIELGTAQSGNRALGETFLDILNNALRAYANSLRDQINHQLMHHLTEPNFGKQARARLEWSDLDINNISKFWKSIIEGTNAGILPMTEELTKLGQEWLNIPVEGHPEGFDPYEARASAAPQEPSKEIDPDSNAGNAE